MGAVHRGVLDLTSRLGAGLAITYFGVPMGIPHTRPLGVITHATRTGLVTAHRGWRTASRCPAARGA